jgi:hypothetical protein
LVTICTLPVEGPAARGVKVMPIAHCTSGTNKARQSDGPFVGGRTRTKSPVADKTLIAEISKSAEPVLVTKIVCAVLVVATVWVAKMSGAGGAGMIATPGTATAEPMPDSDIDVGLGGALLEKSIVPVAAPTTIGVNVMVNVQLPPGATGGVKKGQVVVNANGPVEVGGLRIRLAVPLLVSVTACEGLVVAIVCGAKVTGAPTRAITGAGATTVRTAVLLLVLGPLPAFRLPGTTLKVKTPTVALCTVRVIVQLLLAGIKPMPNV